MLNLFKSYGLSYTEIVHVTCICKVIFYIPAVVIEPTTTVATEPEEDNSTTIILAAILGALAFLLLLGVIIGLCIYCNRDPNKGKPIVENTKPRFEGRGKTIIEHFVSTPHSMNSVMAYLLLFIMLYFKECFGI